MARNVLQKTRASEIGGALGPHGIIDSMALSDRARVRRIQVAIGSATQNSTVTTSAGPLGFRGILLGAYASYTTKPAGGTLLLAAQVYDASAAAAVPLASTDPELFTNRIGTALTELAANATQILEANDTLEATIAADNNTVTAAGVGGVLTFLVLPIEDSDGSSTVTGNRDGT